jgi:hypothetical protein
MNIQSILISEGRFALADRTHVVVALGNRQP